MTHSGSLSRWQTNGIISRELKLYKLLEKKGITTTLMSYGEPNTERRLANVHGINIICIRDYIPWIFRPIEDSAVAKSIGVIIWCLKASDGSFDIAKTNQMRGAWNAVIIRILLGTRVVLRCGYEWHMFAQYANERAYAQALKLAISVICYRVATSVIVATHRDKNHAIKKLGVRPSKITVNGNWIDVTEFKPDPNRKRDDSRIVFLGRADMQKGLHDIINSLPKEKLLEVYGDTTEKFENLLKDRDINRDQIEFKGVIRNTEVSDMMRSRLYFIMPSYYEGHPKSLLEAMSSGMAAICRNSPGVADIVIPGYNGFLFNDRSELHDIFKELDRSPLTVKKIGATARDFIESYYGLKSHVERECDVYARILTRR